MRQGFVVLCVTCFFQTTYSQEWFDDSKTYDGVAILNDKSSARGMFSYDQTNEKLFFEDGKEISSTEAFYFQYYDPKEKINHYFFSFKNTDEVLKFYELLLSGEIPLYGKSQLIEKSYVNRDKNTVEVFFNKKLIETQLYLNDNNTLVKLEDFETQLHPLMKDKIKVISNYIISKQLDITSKVDIIMIIEHYNNH
jgi:hypothetical protein